jgi:hypothetical protein
MSSLLCPGAPKKQKLSLSDDGRKPGIRQPDFVDDEVSSDGSVDSDATPPQTPPQSPRQFECPGAPRAHHGPIKTWGQLKHGASVINTN